MQKKDRVPVVFNTNLIIKRYLKHSRNGLNRRVFDLWREQRALQLVISAPIKNEYLFVLENYARVSPSLLTSFANRLDTATKVTQVNLGSRFDLSRDPKDNMFLDTAHVGRAEFLISNDKDLLDIPKSDLQGFRFSIVTPFEFLQAVGKI